MTEHLGYDDLRADTVRQVAKLMAAAAITAPKSGGQLFLAGKHNFMETVIVEDPATRHELAEWMRARGKERREVIWFRDAGRGRSHRRCSWSASPTGTTQLRLRGLRLRHLRRVPPRHQGPARRLRRARVRRPTCNLRDIDLGIAIGSAAKTAAIHSIDCRCQTRIAVAARKLGIIHADVAVGLSLSLTHKAVGFDRRFPDVEFDSLDLPATGTLPIGLEGGERHGGIRNRQQPRRPIRASYPPA